MQGAWKVGLLVVVFFVLLFGAYGILGKSLFRAESHAFKIRISDASGVNQGTFVTMAGVRIGEVTSIELDGRQAALVHVAIAKPHRIPEGSRAVIAGSVIGFGDTPINIVAPTGAGPLLEPGSTIPGMRASALESSFPELKTTIGELNNTLLSVREFVSDDRLKKDVSALVQNASKTLEQFGRLASGAQTLIAENKGAVKNAMTSLAMAMDDVRKSADLAAKLVGDPAFRQDAKDLLASLNRTTIEAEKLVANLNAALVDPQIRDPLNASMANFEKITESGTKIAANTEEMTKNGIAISKNVEELTRKASALADEAKSVLEKLQQFFDRPPGGVAVKGIQTEMSLIRQSDPARWRTDLSASLPVADGRVHVGVFDAFESNKLTIQYGKPVGKGSEYRYGIYAGKPGIGVDLQLARKLFLRGDLYDINEPQLDFRARYEFGNGLLGWFGFERLFERKKPLTFGLGIRK